MFYVSFAFFLFIHPFSVAVPLGKTKSLVERFEKRETSSIDCSPQTGSCGDHAVLPDGPSSYSVCT